MLLYDYSYQDTFILSSLISACMPMLIGMLAYLAIQYPPKPTRLERFFGITYDDFFTDSKPISKYIPVIAFFITVLALYLEFENYLYIKKVDLFEEINTVSGKVCKIDNSNIMGTDFISFNIADKRFYVRKDQRYVAARNLLNNDSVRVKYFIKKSKYKRVNAFDAEVVKIELK